MPYDHEQLENALKEYVLRFGRPIPLGLSWNIPEQRLQLIQEALWTGVPLPDDPEVKEGFTLMP